MSDALWNTPKPRIKLASSMEVRGRFYTRWVCYSHEGQFLGMGDTPQQAFGAWASCVAHGAPSARARRW